MANKYNQYKYSKPIPKQDAFVNFELTHLIAAKLKRGFALHNSGELEQARVIYEEILKLNPKHFEALQLYGTLAAQTKQWDTAVNLLTKAIAINSTNAFVYNTFGKVLKDLKRFDEALIIFDKAIKFKLDYAEAYSNRGEVLHKLQRLEAALESYDKAIEVENNYADAFYSRGNVLYELKLLDAALLSYGKAIEFKPDYAEAYNNGGNVLKELDRIEDALLSYEKAIECKIDYAEAYFNRAVALDELKSTEAALASYDMAIYFNPDYVNAYYNRGVALRGLNNFEAALKSFEQVFSLQPNYPFIKGDIIHGMMTICKWENLPELVESINHDVDANRLSVNPFSYQGICNCPMLLGAAAKIYSTNKFPPKVKSVYKKIESKNKKIKIAYVSGEFRDQATSVLMIDLWENHDKNRFEIIGLDNGWNDGSRIRERIEKAFDKLINISEISDSGVAALIKDESIDILVNLNCFFGLERNGVFAYKPSPIQVNYLGFPGTLGVDYMDYIIADKIVIPIHLQDFYAEKIVYLPNSYQTNDRKREIADKVFTKEELGLPNDGFVFCCFNNNYKITPHTFNSWMRILKAVEGSVLWLLEDNPSAKFNLRKEAQIRGLDPNRLVFAKRINLPDHLARHINADLFIDTLPYNAHTTASDSLWAGLPVLTCMGMSFAGRVASSLLSAIELPELITATQEEYEATAIELATNRTKLKAIKDKLKRNRLNTALFDTSLFTKHIETAYIEMYERYQSELQPGHIYIEA